jgi:hypothetical protein
MFNSKILVGIAVGTACLFSQAASLADETSSSSSTVSTPAGTATHKVEKSSSALGSSTKVEASHNDATGSHSKVYKATAGPGGAKVSATKTNASVNPDGSVSTSREHESHAVGDAGSTHHKSSSATTVSPDGSTSTVKHEATKTNAN